MEGAALAAERKFDFAIAEAWHAAKFGVMAENGKLRGLSTYIGKKKGKRSLAADAAAFFHRMKAAGMDVDIKKVVRKPS